MKSLLILLLTIVTAGGATVVFNLRDFVQETPGLQRRMFMIQPLSTVKGNITNLVITSERRYWNLGTNVQVNITNMISGTYRCYAYGNTWTSIFLVNIPDTNGTLYASDHITSASSSAIDMEDGNPLDIE